MPRRILTAVKTSLRVGVGVGVLMTVGMRCRRFQGESEDDEGDDVDGAWCRWRGRQP